MIVTIDIERPRLRIMFRGDTVTLIQHADGVPYALEQHKLDYFLQELRKIRDSREER